MVKITTTVVLIFVSLGLISCDTIERKTITVSVDRHPTLVIVNQTGHPVTITAPVSSSLAVGGQALFQPPETNRSIDVSYTIGGIEFTEQVTMENADATITLTRRPPTVTLVNQTGHPVIMTAPAHSNVAVGASHDFLTPSGQALNIAYLIGGFSFNQQVTVTDDMTVNLTERPPELTIVNNTGVPISLKSPISRPLLPPGASVSHLKQSRAVNPLHTVSYTAGLVSFHEQVRLDNQDVTLSLTRRPPELTIVNNTGVTIVNVFIRNLGTPWGAVNMLGIQLNPDGTLIDLRPPPGALAGSLTNMDRFTFWVGHLFATQELNLGTTTVDIRLDDTHGVSYVMNNVDITSDRTLTFTQAHRP